jgi:hypothetical protein
MSKDTDYLAFHSAGDAHRLGDDDFWRADINVFGEKSWLSRINAFGETKEEAEALRDRLLWALSNPIHPELWQYQDMENPDVWHNCADVGEVVRAKANGHNTRGLYLKKPLIPN